MENGVLFLRSRLSPPTERMALTRKPPDCRGIFWSGDTEAHNETSTTTQRLFLTLTVFMNIHFSWKRWNPGDKPPVVDGAPYDPCIAT